MFARLAQLPIKRHAGTIAVMLGCLLFAAGLVMFVLSMRPSRFAITPGEWLQYRVHKEGVELLDGGGERAPIVTDDDVLMVGAGQDNLVLFAVAGPSRTFAASVSISSDGQVRSCDATGRRGDAGIAVGWFDFSLCVLPPGSDQAWEEPELVYAALPPQRRVVQAKVRRMRSGTTPEFQIKLPPSIEWINGSGRYEQLRDALCTYRFANGHQAVEKADLKLVAAEETATGRKRIRWHYEVTLVGRGHIDDKPQAIRDLALTGSALLEAQASNRREQVPTLLSRLAHTDVNDRRLRDLAQRLIDQARNDGKNSGTSTMAGSDRRMAPVGNRVTPAQQWEVVVATLTQNQAAEANQIHHRLNSKGLVSSVRTTPRGCSVVAGPYNKQEQAVLTTLATIFPNRRFAWTAAP